MQHHYSTRLLLHSKQPIAHSFLILENSKSMAYTMHTYSAASCSTISEVTLTQHSPGTFISKNNKMNPWWIVLLSWVGECLPIRMLNSVLKAYHERSACRYGCRNVLMALSKTSDGMEIACCNASFAPHNSTFNISHKHSRKRVAFG